MYFSCDVCQSVFKRAQLARHPHQYFSCVDCSQTFDHSNVHTHTQCISEAEKYQGKLYQGKRKAADPPAAPAKEAKKEESETEFVSSLIAKRGSVSLRKLAKKFSKRFPAVDFSVWVREHGDAFAVSAADS